MFRYGLPPQKAPLQPYSTALLISLPVSIINLKTSSQARLLGDKRWVEGGAANLGVSVGTFAQLQMDAWYPNGVGKAALSAVYGALHLDETPLAAAISEGRDADARTLLRTHPKHAQLKHRGLLPIHTLVERLGDTGSSAALDEETGEIFTHTSPAANRNIPDTTTAAAAAAAAAVAAAAAAGAPVDVAADDVADAAVDVAVDAAESMALLEELIRAYPESVSIRSDSNWGLGYADGLFPLQLAASHVMEGEDDVARMNPERLIQAVLRLNVPLLASLAAHSEPAVFDAPARRFDGGYRDGGELSVRNALHRFKDTLGIACSEVRERLCVQSDAGAPGDYAQHELADCLESCWEHLKEAFGTIVMPAAPRSGESERGVWKQRTHASTRIEYSRDW